MNEVERQAAAHVAQELIVSTLLNGGELRFAWENHSLRCTFVRWEVEVSYFISWDRLQHATPGMLDRLVSHMIEYFSRRTVELAK